MPFWSRGIGACVTHRTVGDTECVIAELEAKFSGSDERFVPHVRTALKRVAVEKQVARYSLASNPGDERERRNPGLW